MAEYVTRQHTAAEWNQRNPILRDGELGLERDTGKVKIGSGISRWKQIGYTLDPPPLYPPTFDPPGVGGPSAVASVNGKTGAVVLSAGDIGGTFSDNQIPSSIARDSELASAISTALAGITFPAAYTDEQARDAVAQMFANGTHQNITVTYDDQAAAAGSISLAGSAGGGGGSGPSTGRNALTGMWHFSGYSGVDATGAADQTALLQTVVNAVSTAGGGVIYFDPGTYRLNNSVVLKNGVSLSGVHRSLVTFKGYQIDSAVFRAIPSDGTSAVAPLRDATYSGFKIDANNQTLSGAYTSAVKGFFIQHMRRITFKDLWIDGTGASSIGVDFLYEACTIDNCLISNYGRLNSGNGPGSSGIGLGTASTTDIEAFSVTRCHVVGGTGSRFGIFVESQNEGGTNQFAQSTFGGRITDNYIQGGQWGIGDAGNKHLLIAHNQVTATTIAGIVVNGGTFTQGRTGFYGEISNNQLWGNKLGIHLDYAKVNTISYTGHYTVRDNHIGTSTDNGILLEARLVNLSAIQIIGNIVHHSGKTGVLIQYSGSSPTAVLDKCSINDNVVYANGTGGTTGTNDGIRISVPLTDSDFVGNKCFDPQATKTQRYGLVLTVACTGGRLIDNDVRGNLLGPVLLSGASFVNAQVASNPGWNPPAPAAVTVPASGANYTAPDYPTSLLVTGGTVTAVTVSGVAAPTSGLLLLEPLDVVVFTYSAVPTVFTRPRS